MKCWFDQLGFDPSIWPFFGVDAETLLAVCAMGYRPACKVANGTLGALVPPHDDELEADAKFVDNVALYGNEETATRQMTHFKERCRAVGAQINDEDNTARQTYEFLGEAYDHVKKTKDFKKYFALVSGLLRAQISCLNFFRVKDIFSDVAVKMVVHHCLRVTCILWQD
jgi:hypothetical protein